MRNPRIMLIAAAALLPMAAFAVDVAALVRDGEGKEALAAIRGGADVNAAQPDGTTPLMWAASRADVSTAMELLKLGAKPGGRNSLGATVLTEAIPTGNTELIDQLLKAGADPNLGNFDDQTPLMLAARAGSLPIVEMLVKAGAKVDTREKFRGQSALMWAVGSNSAGAAAVTEFLIKQGAEVDFRSAVNDWGNQMTGEPRAQYRASGGLTPLLYATRSGCIECARLLLTAGATLEKPTPDGVSPLINAIDAGNYAMAAFLLDQGANPHLQDWWGRTALYVAIDQHARSIRLGSGAPVRARAAAPRVTSLQIAQLLLERGVDPNTSLDMHRPFLGRFTDDLMNTGCTPLLRAALGFDREAVELLLKHGALVDLPNVMGVTPLMAASGIGWGVGGSGPGQSPDVKLNDEAANRQMESNALAVIEILLGAGADINARITDTSSRTARIARPSSMSERQGQTAIFGAVGAGTVTEVHPARNWLRVAQYLIDHGAKLDIKDARGRTLLDALVGPEPGEQQVSRGGGRDSPSTPEMVALIRKSMGLPPAPVVPAAGPSASTE